MRSVFVSFIAADLALTAMAVAGPYSPPADLPNSTAIAATDSRIVEWASGFTDLVRGPIDITNPTGTLASSGVGTNALGQAGATADNPFSIVSLGDGGSITLSFDKAIRNGTGADFAVYENGFYLTGNNTLTFAELAFVYVSSDGVHFTRFPSVSLTQTATQVAAFGTLDPTNIYNLAGQFVAGYGTPFDLSDLTASDTLDVNNIKFVRVVDVIGTINPTYASHDSLGNIINDPFKTNFATGGFDLDGVGVLNVVPEPTSIALAAFAAGGVLLRRRRQR